MVARNGSGCQECRDRHVKCDKIEPVCGRCASTGKTCTRGLVFKRQKKEFSHDRDWFALKSANEYQWIDESKNRMDDTGDSASEDKDGDGSTNGHPGSLSPKDTHMRHKAQVPSPVSTLAISPHHSEHAQSPWPANLGGTPETVFHTPPHRPVEPNFSHAHHVFLPPDIPPLRDPSRFNTNQPPILRTDDSVWPLKDATEARLFRHYVQDLAKWLDLCDPNQHFQVEVPKRAPKYPVLLKAILALSARQLMLTNRASESNEIAARQYYDQCIKLLIPMLDNVITRADETLFAALIILRVLEEIDLLETGSQDTKHIQGIQSFVREHGPNVMQGGLSEAAFWVGLRQEIYVATITHRAVQIDIGHIDRTVDPITDFGWANRAVVHLADVLNCCFGVRGVHPVHWSRLQAESHRWQRDKPDSFTPYYQRPADRSKGEAFPEILHIHPCHIIGIQHHKLAQILLSIYNPRRPRIGKDRQEAEQAMVTGIKDNLRELCGIGLHNRSTPPGMFTACMGIALCGDRFRDRLEQEALLELLIETQKDHARPTAAIQMQMKSNWGWSEYAVT
ncbi:hypothetical protein ONS95_010938 [Cadophora gregata]|uniref:uncharacterized protein n=1 Tax=Cadophora gregata TaxID=51156 RepID=UPI0026DB16AC|nr:uncharacterized protein ONS95_010938 [Cadophora gregata]KAK0119490.1 hypothetical protein ONS95_010938 [Cadophora gregata]